MNGSGKYVVFAAQLPPPLQAPPPPHLRLLPCSPAAACGRRDDLLPIGIDVNPALEVHGEFVRDLPSPVSRAAGRHWEGRRLHWFAPHGVQSSIVLACMGRGQGGITGCLVHTFHALTTLPPLPPASLPGLAWPQDACFVLQLVKQEQG